MKVPLRLSAYPSEAGQSETPASAASALLLGLVVRHLCERLDLPASELVARLEHEVRSLEPSDSALAQALAQQLAVVQAVVALPEPPACLTRS